MPTEEEKTIIQGYIKGTTTPVTLALNAAGEIEVTFDPEDILQVQDQGQIYNDEATVTLVNFTGDGEDVLDKDTATEIVVTDPTAVSQIRIDTDQPMYVGYVGVRPGASGDLATIATITITDLFGVVHQRFVRAGAGLTADGIDTGPFSSIPAIRIDIDFGIAGLGNDYDVSQVVIYKDKGRQYTNAFPLPVQVPQQLTIDDIDVAASDAVLPGGSVGSVANLFDKDLATTLVTPAGAATVRIILRSPLLMGRAAIMGAIDSLGLSVVGVTATVQWIAQNVGAGFDSDNQDEVFVQEIQLIQGVPSGGSTLTQVMGSKVIQDVNIPFRDALNDIIMTAQLVSNPVPRGPGGVVFVNPASLGGSGFTIEKQYNLAVNIELEIEDTDGSGLINIQIDWYYSADDADYFFMGSTEIIIPAGVTPSGSPNPYGFVAAGGAAFVNLAHPLTSFANFIAPVVVNNDIVSDVTVTETLTRQR